MKPLLLSLAVAAITAAASPLAAEDFEFEIPVQVSKLDASFTQGKVSCEIRGISRDASTGQATGHRGLIASGVTTFPISGGSYDGTVAVRFNANRPVTQAADGRSYICILSLAAGANVGALCTIDVVTGVQTGRPGPAWMKLAPGSVKGCAIGDLPGFSSTGK